MFTIQNDKPIIEEKGPLILPMQFFARESDDSDDDWDDDSSEDTDFEETEDEADEGDELTDQDLEEDEESTDESEAEEELEEKPPTDAPKQKIKYNGQELELTMEEMISFAQKGMNYDKVNSKLESLKNSKELKLISKAAKRNGMTTEQYVAEIERVEKQQRIEEQVAKGIPREAAERLLVLEEKEEQRTQAENDKKQQDTVNQQFQALLKEYPDVKQLPNEVISMMESQGVSPLEAYRTYENKQLKAEIQALKQNKKLSEKSIGSMQGEGPAKRKSSFEEGFDSVF